jgi:hypothetical protein
MVRYKKQYKVAQYGQWDGYPSGQGANVLNFLHSVNLDQFKKKLERVRLLNHEDPKDKEFVDRLNESLDAKSMDILAKRLFDKFFTRDLGSKVLWSIMSASEDDGEILLNGDLEFVKDSLFCEWAYLIDLDKGVLEVYKGFNTKPLAKSQRFYGDGKRNGEKYYPIRCIKKYKLDKLPTLEKFLKELEPKDDE